MAGLDGSTCAPCLACRQDRAPPARTASAAGDPAATAGLRGGYRLEARRRSAIRRSEATRRSTSVRRTALRACIARASSAAATGGWAAVVGWVDTVLKRLGMVCERVEAFGELHDEPAEVVELCLEVDGGCGCVVGGFGFGFVA